VEADGTQRRRRGGRQGSAQDEDQQAADHQDGSSSLPHLRPQSRPRRSRRAKSSGGTAGENKKPWYSLQPWRWRKSRWRTSSTPSATTRSPSWRAIAIVALVMAASSEELATPRTKDWSILSTSIGKRLR